MKKENPYFSVIIPAYNAEKNIAFALRSVLQQTFEDFEIIVVNDGSIDNTSGEIEKFKDSRIIVLHQENQGECESRNRAIKHAKGKFLAFLDSDDAWVSNHLIIAWNFFENFPEIAWYYSDIKAVDEVRDIDIVDLDVDRVDFLLENLFLLKNLSLSSSIIIKKSMLKQQEIFPKGFKMHGDNIAWCRIAMDFPMIGHANIVTSIYRRWEGSVTRDYLSNIIIKFPLAQPALEEHANMYARKNCSIEARLFFRWFSLNNWWMRIRGMSMLVWLEDIKKRSLVTGGILTIVLISLAYLSEFICRSVGKILRIRFMLIQRKIHNMRLLNTKLLGYAVKNKQVYIVQRFKNSR